MFRKTKISPPLEWQDQESIIKALSEYCFVYVSASGLRLPVGLRQKAKRMGMIQENQPDISFCMKTHKDFTVFLEIKRHKLGSLSHGQKKALSETSNSGYMSLRCSGVLEGMALVHRVEIANRYTRNILPFPSNALDPLRDYAEFLIDKKDSIFIRLLQKFVLTNKNIAPYYVSILPEGFFK